MVNTICDCKVTLVRCGLLILTFDLTTSKAYSYLTLTFRVDTFQTLYVGGELCPYLANVKHIALLHIVQV